MKSKPKDFKLMESEVEAAKKARFLLNVSRSRSYSILFYVEAEAAEEEFSNLEAEGEAMKKEILYF